MDLEILEIAEDTNNNKNLENHTHYSKLKNPLCGDEIQIKLTVKKNKIINFGYEEKSCVYCKASASLLSKISVNKQIIRINELCKDAEAFFDKKNTAKNLVLDQEVSFDQLDETKIVSLNLKAGQISLHNDALLHGSEANNSERRRCGVTMRFSPTNVKGDLKIWPFFETQLARGIDEFKLNPTAQIPRGEATPLKMFSFSREFENEW